LGLEEETYFYFDLIENNEMLNQGALFDFVIKLSV
jgi:hypothetical protein